MTTTFLAIGGVSLLVLLVSVVVGDVGHLSADADGPFSLPAIAAFFGGGGFAGGIASALLSDSLSSLARLLISLAVALVVAFPLAFAAIKLASTLMHLPTDETLTSASILGAHGVVVTAVTSAASFGEVRLNVGGHLLKYNARSQVPLTVGTPVYVVDVPTATSVEVVSTAFDPSVSPPQ
jgi:membrane protein implicated in regulation of membrane protease activity